MRTALLLTLLLPFKKPVIASAQLVERQTQELWNPAETIGATFTFLGGVGAYVGNAIGNLFQDPKESDTSKTIPPPTPNTDTESDGQSSSDSLKASPPSPPAPAALPDEPVYKINIQNDQSKAPDTDTVPNLSGAPPSVNEECDMINNPDCGKTTDQLVFTSSCIGINPNKAVSVEARAQNQAIQAVLNSMNSQNRLAGMEGLGLRTSMSKICDVYFWAVPLTEGQIQEIEKLNNVDMVRPNQDLHIDPETLDLGDSSPAENPVLGTSVFAAPGSRLKERDELVNDVSAWEDLRFISTPPSSPMLSNAYSYYSKAGEEMINIAVDTGVNLLHDEFRNEAGESSILANPIYGMDTSNLDDEDSLGTCRTSKIVGRNFGVAKKAKVMMAKVSPQPSSMIDVFVQISNYLLTKVINMEKVKGYHVMSIMTKLNIDDQKITDRFDEIFDLLIRNFQLVVVVPCININEENALTHMWPVTAAAKHDIIVVGAVEVQTGRTYDFSRGGALPLLLSVNAPGKVKCAVNRAGREFRFRTGTDVAAALVAGVISYLLSGEETGPILRRNRAEIPEMVKRYVRFTASYKRQDDDFPAIWNLVGAESVQYRAKT